MDADLPSSIYDFTVKHIQGHDVSLSTFRGKDCVWNVTLFSGSGLTKTNYTELTELYSKYKDEGLEILAFPCNQFEGEEPGTNEEILEFACTKFKAEFPIFDKIDVNGEDAAPIYEFLKNAKGGDPIEWNFAKFLVSRDGEVVQRVIPTSSPFKFEDDLKRLLSAS